MARPVELIDPINSVSINDLPNGTPKYENLFIFAELLGERRERSVLTLDSGKGGISLKTQLTNSNVNMFGVDFEKDVNKSSKLTTNWSNNRSDSDILLEGFGVESIDVKIDSSYMPKVTIEFVDIRGLTFYNLGENSPYSLLLDFPPPIFKMTLKGYYGKSLDYDLHLVKSNTRFDSNTSNYYISVEFVARTFAPLADIPFKFAELVSLMANDTRESSDPKTQESSIQDNINSINQDKLNVDSRVIPRNTYELVKKLKILTDSLKDIKNISIEGKRFIESKDSLSNGENIIRTINDFKSFLPTEYLNSGKIIIKNNDKNPDSGNKDNGGDFRILRKVEDFDSIIKASDNPNKINDELYLMVKYYSVRNGNISGDTSVSQELKNSVDRLNSRLIEDGARFSNNNFNSKLIKTTTINDYEPENLQNSDTNESINGYDIYYGLDITQYYVQLNKILKTKRDNIKESKNDLVKVINDRVINTLGYKPTIYNIFKILCDDIDTFFKVLGGVAVKGQEHHNKYFDLIVDQIEENKSKNITKTIYPFPLYIETQTTCGVTKKVRKIPKIDLVPEEDFPEVSFINNFIETMITNRKVESVIDLISDVDSNGNNKWIPITPADSILNTSDGVAYQSPYINLTTQSVDTDNLTTSIYSRLLNRFYIASQFTYGKSFYSNNEKFIFWGKNELLRDDLIKYVAESEAINLSNSLINDSLINNIKNNAKTYSRDLTSFYSELKKLPNWNSIDSEKLNLNDNTQPLYRNRKNENYLGFEILNEIPSTRVSNENSNDPINKFLDRTSSWWSFIKNDGINQFTTENIPFFSDYNSSDKYVTKYIRGFNDIGNIYSDGDYVETLSVLLYNNFDEIYILLRDNDININTKSLLLVSMFGNARSYFSDSGIYENKTFLVNIGSVNSYFLNPAVIEVPKFSIYYMGALIDYNINNVVKDEIDNLMEEDWLKNVLILSSFKKDVESINNLSSNDKDIFLKEYYNWIESSTNNGYLQFMTDLDNIMTKVDNNITFSSFRSRKRENFDKIIKIITDGKYTSIDDDLISKTAILNYSELTFNNEINTEINYLPISITNIDLTGSNTSKRSANNTFFTSFWKKLVEILPEKEEETKKLDNKLRSGFNDEDIKTQLYYTFKNISDKWNSGNKSSQFGFPLNNDREDSLIKKFAFVDRAMNPIGDEVIINAESLIEMSKDYDLNMFQVFSRLLSLNGFEFFPLQNFMSFNDSDLKWSDCFRIFETLEQKSTPAFVCMYIGGTSSTLENTSSSFDNDGILDLKNESLSDFNNSNECENSKEVIDSNSRTLINESRFKYSEPKAFRVRFAEQNQSYFTNIEIEGREFPATSDSLAILSRIAGDGGESPIPKGQNLFSLYENRAYSVKVTMLGNVMIQPTQYFQLDNIPMYSGAYLILEVNHNIKDNHMTTTFKGVKVLKFPNPFVKNFATLVGINSGTSEDISGNETEGGIISARTLPTNVNLDLYYNEMFTLKISP